MYHDCIAFFLADLSGCQRFCHIAAQWDVLTFLYRHSRSRGPDRQAVVGRQSFCTHEGQKTDN